MKFNLSKPIELTNGTKLDELELNFDDLSLADEVSAHKIKRIFYKEDKEDKSVSISPRLDPHFRIAFSWVAAMHGTSGLMREDVLQLSAKDALEISETALDYLF